jgi:hypothetical protein
MSRTIEIAILRNRHAAMLAYQKQIAPFTPTVQDMVSVWGAASKSHAHWILNNLLEFGAVIVRTVGKVRRYYAVEWKE